MFEKFSGFFKRFTRRPKKQSGETTIMDAKDPGLEDMGLDESFGDLSDLEQSIDKIGTAPVDTEGAMGAGMSFSDADLGSADMDFSTGASDFDEQTISDEVSGEKVSAGFEETVSEAEAPAAPFAEERLGEMAYGEPLAEAKPPSGKRRILVTFIAAVVALAVGGVFQIFGWPYVGKMVGLVDKEEAQVDVEGQLAAAKKENVKLKSEVGQFKGIGSPAEVKNLQQQIAQARDSQGPVEELEKQFNTAKEKEAAYDELVKKINELESSIGQTRSDINGVRLRIEEAKLKVIALRKQTEVEYARFQNELARAEISQRTLIELENEFNQQFQREVQKLQDYLARLENSKEAPSIPLNEQAIEKPEDIEVEAQPVEKPEIAEESQIITTNEIIQEIQNAPEEDILLEQPPGLQKTEDVTIPEPAEEGQIITTDEIIQDNQSAPEDAPLEQPDEEAEDVSIPEPAEQPEVGKDVNDVNNVEDVDDVDSANDSHSDAAQS